MFLNKIKNIKEEIINKQKQPKKNILKTFLDKEFNIISEIKKASPSLGDIQPEADILKIAKGYYNNGATAISVLTETDYFKGDINYIKAIRENLPEAILLRKDFIIDDYQIYEAKIYGADMILLILALTGVDKTKELIKTANNLGLEVLLEVHSEEEMLEALKMNVNFIGVNNRDLKTLKTTLDISRNLAKYITKDKVFVCESGLNSALEIKEMIELGYKAFLIGTSFMKSDKPEAELKKLIDEVNKCKK